MAGGGMGMGMGFAMANQMGQQLSQQQNPSSQPETGGTPPPPPPALLFHVVINGEQAGPFDMNAIKQMVSSNQVTKDSLVWRNGMSTWTAAGEVDELKSTFGSVPPPLPPQ